jgi:hypothetical protein
VTLTSFLDLEFGKPKKKLKNKYLETILEKELEYEYAYDNDFDFDDRKVPETIFNYRDSERISARLKSLNGNIFTLLAEENSHNNPQNLVASTRQI